MSKRPEELIKQMEDWELDVDVEFDVNNEALLDSLNQTAFPTQKIYPDKNKSTSKFPRIKGRFTVLNNQDLSGLPGSEKALALVGIVECLGKIGLQPVKATIQDGAVDVEFVLIEENFLENMGA